MRRYIKAILAAGGALTPATVAAVFSLFGVDLDFQSLVVLLASVSPITAAIAVGFGPANEPDPNA
jgi:hypothetical protein